ncbi:uncharacterized protein J4E78_007287 [Alternaria triticimaculans]|uniref:uncharacterized protein n=1 Tax=Alternaria triticimaculans TaxID=297637 RepID=UPI0020C515C4|nr:uncharacterized protein J4E78_007287 [Alternaria triticimaculans]KAI4654242.1 hypothetical protein J4E78_007287 [Alternaria triticimaculans]
MFYRSPEERQNGIHLHSVEDDAIYKASFIRYRNAAMPNLLSQIVQLCTETTELDSRCSIPQVFINRPMLDEYIRISGTYAGGLETDTPQPWESQTALWEFISKTSFARVTLGSGNFPSPPSDDERAELMLLQRLIQRRLARANDGNLDDGTA